MTETIDLMKLPEGPLEKRVHLLRPAFEQGLESTLRYLREEYPSRELLEECMSFASFNLVDAARGDAEALIKVWYFPWVEAERELEEAINRILWCSYKASYDNLRRALELVLCGVYFTLDAVPTVKARRWINSRDGTPFFSNTLKKLLQNQRFRSVDEDADWSASVKQLYGQISDVIHTRGTKNSLDELQPSNAHICGVSLPTFQKNLARRTLDVYVDTVRQICTIIAISNPVLLMGLPLDEKFGLNPPASGFFNEAQALRLRALLMSEYRETIISLAESDEEVADVLGWIHSRPDLTAEEMEEQVQDFRKRWGLDRRGVGETAGE